MSIWAGAAFADEYSYIYKGIRPMGMGGAFVAVSDDANALFYNPAGLARIEKTRMSILPLEVEVAKNSLDIYKDASDVDFDDPTETTEFLRDNIGERAHLAVNVFPYYSRPRFALAFYGTARVDLEVENRAYPEVYTHVVSDMGGAIGYAHPLLDDALSLGGTFKFNHRQSLKETYTVTDITGDLNDEIKDDLQKGNGILIDLGVQYSFKEYDLEALRVGMSANNLGGASMGDAEDIDDHVDIGVSYVIDKLWITKTTLAFDYVDLFSQYSGDDDIAKRIRMGVEFKFPVLLTLRLGLYEGYFSGGVSLDGKFVQLDVLTYTEEIGAYAGQRDDTRYVMRFLMGF
jgi:hypothetical protein